MGPYGTRQRSERQRTTRPRRTSRTAARRPTVTTIIMGSGAATGGSGVLVATHGPDHLIPDGTTRIQTKTRTEDIIGTVGIVATEGMIAATVAHTLTAGTLGVTADGTTTVVVGRT